MTDKAVVNHWTESKSVNRNEGLSVANTRVSSCFKIIVIGASSVGKTCLVHRFINRTFSNVSATVGNGLFCKNISIGGEAIMLQIFDTAGLERFNCSLMSHYYRGAKAIVFVYDVTQNETFLCLPKWMDRCSHQFEDENLVRILIGNKCDETEKTAVSPAMARKFAFANNMTPYRTSAKDPAQAGQIDSVFVTIAYKVTKPPPDSSWNWIDPVPSHSLQIRHPTFGFPQPITPKSGNCC